MGTENDTTHRDWRDLAIRDLADENILLLERVVNAEADRDAYRELAQQGIHALRTLTLERDRLKRRLAELLDHLRRLQGMRQAA